MMIDEGLHRLGLKFSPFPPATTGVAIIKAGISHINSN